MACFLIARAKDLSALRIKADLQDVGWGHGLDYSSSVYGQVAGACEYGMDFLFRKMRRIY